jgi:cytidine deaminase
VAELSAEDAKLVTLARTARARIGAAQGAAVRDQDGRAYAAASVALAALTLSAAQVAVAMAVSSGARTLEAAVILGERPDQASLAALHELGPDVTVHLADADGTVTASY